MDLRETLKIVDKAERGSKARPANMHEVPILDLSNLQAGLPYEELATKLRLSCINIGFAYIVNHGVPEELIDRMFDVSRRFFSLPTEEKLKVKLNRFKRGYARQGINQHPGYEPDLKEFYEFANDRPLTDPKVLADLPMHGPNLWPADHPWLREACDAYFNEMMSLGHRLLPVFSQSLGMPRDYLSSFFLDAMGIGRLFRYPPSKAVKADVFGAAPHTDYGALTILAQDPIGGLEVRTRSGEWIAAPYIKGTLVINLGDLFRVWTNDLYVSTLHRVVNNAGKERYSVPFFFNPAYQSLISCIPTCQSPDNPPKYQPVVNGEYFTSRYQAVVRT
jgi:isopenicillin N synthase-like dioxygenase